MELIAEKPLYFGQRRGGVVPGQVFEMDEHYGRQLLAEGKASIRPVSTVASTKLGYVTCIMPTRNRRQWVPRAIELFRAQTYERKELLIVDSGDSVADLVPQDPRITYIHASVGMKLGALRNFCCGRSDAEFIAHWDDDDWYHPERLAEQVAAVEGHQVVAYNRCHFDGEPGQYLYKAPANHGIGSSLLFRRSWWEKNRFAPLQISEDAQFIERAVRVTNFVDGAGRMVASIHPGNTSARMVKADAYKKATAADLPPEYFT